MEIIKRKIEMGESVHDHIAFDDVPMTTWHGDFEEGFWFAAMVAYDETIPISVVVCLNLTVNCCKGYLANLIDKITIGWLPGD
jgi:hypothetical protein